MTRHRRRHQEAHDTQRMRDEMGGAATPASAILMLQRTAGNQAVVRRFARSQRAIARQGPTIGSTATVTGAMQADAQQPTVQALIQTLTGLANPGQRTRTQL